MCDIIHMELKN